MSKRNGQIAPIRGPGGLRRRLRCHAKPRRGSRPTRRCCGSGRRPSTWWRPARWMRVWHRHFADCAQLVPLAPRRPHLDRPRLRRRLSGPGGGHPAGGRCRSHLPRWSRLPPPLTPPRKGEGDATAPTPHHPDRERHPQVRLPARGGAPDRHRAACRCGYPVDKNRDQRQLKLICRCRTWSRRVPWRRSTGCLALAAPLSPPGTVGLILEGPRRRHGARGCQKDRGISTSSWSRASPSRDGRIVVDPQPRAKAKRRTDP